MEELTKQEIIEKIENTQKRVVDKNYILNAISKYTTTINSNPKAEYAYINRAYLNYLLGNLENAIEDYDILISLNPNDIARALFPP